MKLPFVNIHTHHPTENELSIRTAGVHPWQAEQASIATLESEIGRIEAVGEIGLDYAREIDRAKQLELLRQQLALAEEHHLPVVLHCVRAFEPMLAELRTYTLSGVIFHGFIGSPQQAKQATDRGYYLSFGERTFASPKTVASLLATPHDRLFLETDESDTPIEQIYEQTATVLGCPIDRLKEITYTNYRRLFSINNG